MSTIFSELGQFLWAVITNWAGYATGGVVVALVWLWSILSKIPPSRKFGIVLALVFLFVAFFNAWRLKHHALLDLQKRLKAPEFEMKEAEAAWGSHNTKPMMFVMVHGFITNPHGPASAAISWKMKLETASKSEVGVIPASSGTDVTIPMGQTGVKLTLKHSHYWPLVTANGIQPGDTAEGWIIALFKDISEADLKREDGKVTISFNDVVENKLHSFTVPIDESRRGIKIPEVF